MVMDILITTTMAAIQVTTMADIITEATMMAAVVATTADTIKQLKLYPDSQLYHSLHRYFEILNCTGGVVG